MDTLSSGIFLSMWFLQPEKSFFYVKSRILSASSTMVLEYSTAILI